MTAERAVGTQTLQSEQWIISERISPSLLLSERCPDNDCLPEFIQKGSNTCFLLFVQQSYLGSVGNWNDASLERGVCWGQTCFSVTEDLLLNNKGIVGHFNRDGWLPLGAPHNGFL